LTLLVVVAVFARHNWKTGRADVRGAALVGVATFTALRLSQIMGTHDTPVAPLAAAASFSQGDWIESIVMVLIVVLNVLMMVRFGLLALVVMGAVGVFIQRGLLTNNFGAWYGESSLVVVVVVSALALWAFRTSLGGRPLLSADPAKA
jgi:hypothetical protein